jgi:intermediate cleaving peptidase 55
MLKRTLCLRQWRHCLSHSRYCAPRFQCNLPSRQAACRRTYASISAAELHFGQPVHETHSHILEPGECLYTLHRYSHLYKTICVTNAGKIVTPGITALEYAQRRSRLANRLPKNAIAVLAAAEIKYRAPGIFYEYHQDADFFYLTGFTEPGALAMDLGIIMSSTSTSGKRTGRSNFGKALDQAPKQLWMFSMRTK